MADNGENSGAISGKIWSSENACILVEIYKPYHNSLEVIDMPDKLKNSAWNHITNHYKLSSEEERKPEEIEEKVRKIKTDTNKYVTLLNKNLISDREKAANPSKEVLKMYNILYGDDQRGAGAGVDTESKGKIDIASQQPGAASDSSSTICVRRAPVQSQSQQQQQNVTQCRYCGIHKHTVKRCWNLQDAKEIWQNNQGKSPCGHCGEIGHTRVDCRYFQAAKQKLNGQEPISIEQVGLAIAN